jgi:hypothetical protein
VASPPGLNVCEFMNEILDERLEFAPHEKLGKIQKKLKMVRGGGFEPPK